MLAETGEWLETIISISLTHSVIGSSIPDCGPEVTGFPRTVLLPSFSAVVQPAGCSRYRPVDQPVRCKQHAVTLLSIKAL